MTCTELGPVTPTDYCQMNGIKYYNNCKTCENKCSLDSCPEGVVCEYEDCSQKYCDIGCEVNYTNWCTAPETNCTTLGYIKTEADCVGSVLRCPYDTSKVICEGDGNETCEARASIISSCPENATCTYYNDCPSKIQDWTCNEGYKLFESKCIKPLPILYSDGTISYEKLNDKKPIGIIFDEQNRLAVALSDVTQNGTSGNAIMYWSSGYCDTPNLAQCKSGTEFICGTDGRENTNYILASTCDGETYAANAVNKYYVSCSQDFCQKGKWFLPSVKELREIGASILSIKYAFEVLDSSSSRLKESSYWSSTAMSDSSAWLFNMYSQEASHTGKQNYSNVRAIVKY